MNKLVTTDINTIAVRIQAIRSASLSVVPDFSPNALAQSLQICFNDFSFRRKRKRNTILHRLCYVHGETPRL